MYKTENLTRTFLYPKGGELIQNENGLHFTCKDKVWGKDEVIKAMSKIPHVKKVEPFDNLYFKDELCYVYEPNENAYVTIVFEEEQEKGFCSKLTCQFYPQEESYQALISFIDKINSLLPLKIYSCIFHSKITLEEMRKFNFRDARKEGISKIRSIYGKNKSK